MSEHVILVAIRHLILSGISQPKLLEAIAEMEEVVKESYRRPLSGAERTAKWRVTKSDVTNVTKESSPHTPLKEKPPCPPKRGTSPQGVDEEFPEFWSGYPRKDDKGHALKAYRQARKKATAAELVAGVARLSAAMRGKEREFIPHAATWLNGERWLDEGVPKPTTTMGPRLEFKPEKPKLTADQWRALRANGKAKDDGAPLPVRKAQTGAGDSLPHGVHHGKPPT